MKYPKDLRPIFGAIAVALPGTFASTTALATCMAMGNTSGGLPQISAIETSTAQALEQIRQRRQQVAQACPAGLVLVGTTCVPSDSAAAATVQPAAAATPTPAAQQAAAAAPPAATAPQPAPQATAPAAPAKGRAAAQRAKAPPKPAPVPTPPPSAPEPYASLKDAPVAEAVPSVVRTHGVWAEGYVDWERHSNLAPGEQENPTRNQVSAGALAGIDWTYRRLDPVLEGVQIGVFSGYNETHSDFSNTRFTLSGVDFVRSDNEQDIEGAFVGGYGAYFKDRFALDLMVKVDLFELSQRSKLTEIGCTEIDFNRGRADQTDYIIASNASYRFDLGLNRWVAPTVGVRYTITNYDNDRNTTVEVDTSADPPTVTETFRGRLGLDDGSVLRVQGGLRFGDGWLTPEGWLWSHTIAGLLYSDVLVEGLTFSSGAGVGGGTVSPVDEGKVRALAQLTGKLDLLDGRSYYGLVEVRGGEDVIGVGGKLGMRYEW